MKKLKSCVAGSLCGFRSALQLEVSQVSLKRVGQSVILLLGTLSLACDRPAHRLQAHVVDTISPFAVFSKPSLTMTALDQPTLAPLVAGSTHSASTLRSDKPEIVSVEQDGKLVAHAVGVARINATGSKTPLVVNVVTGKLAILPSSLDMVVGSTAQLKLSVGGIDVRPEDATWLMSNPGTADVHIGIVHAHKPGNSVMVAKLGGLSSDPATVVVTQPPPSKPIIARQP